MVVPHLWRFQGVHHHHATMGRHGFGFGLSNSRGQYSTDGSGKGKGGGVTLEERRWAVDYNSYNRMTRGIGYGNAHLRSYWSAWPDFTQ